MFTRKSRIRSKFIFQVYFRELVAIEQGEVDFRSRRLLSAGRALSLLVAALLRGLTCPAAPAGVKRLPLQSTCLIKSSHLQKQGNLNLLEHCLLQKKQGCPKLRTPFFIVLTILTLLFKVGINFPTYDDDERCQVKPN